MNDGNSLESLLQTAQLLESEGNLDGAIKLLSDFLSVPTNTNDLSQAELIKASTKLSRLKEVRDRAKTLREEAMRAEKSSDYSAAEQKWRDLLSILPNDLEVKDRLETLPERRRHSESIRLKLSVQDAMERDQGVLAAKCLEEYRSLFPADLWAIEMLPKVQEAKEKEERLELQRQLKDAMSRNRHRLAIQVGEAMQKRGWLEGHELDLYRHAQSKLTELSTLKQRGAELYTLGDLKAALRCYDEAQMIDSDDPTISEEGVRIRKVISLVDSLKIALRDNNNERVERIVHELALLRHDSEDVQEIIREHRKKGKKRRMVIAFAAAVIAVIAAGIYLSDTDRKTTPSSTARSSQSDLPYHQPPAPLPAASSPATSDRSEFPTELRWETKAPMPTPRVGMVGGVIGSDIYAVGGKDVAGRVVGSLEVYSVETDSWTTRTPMPTHRASAEGAVIDGKLYVAGGVDSANTFLRTLEVYDPQTDSWSELSPMLTPRRLFGLCSLQGRLYAIAGLDSPNNPINSCERFNPTTQRWEHIADLPTARSGHGVAAIEGRIYAIAGWSNRQESIVEVYDPSTNAWRSAPPLPTPRYRFGVATIGSLVFAIGGSTSAVNEIFNHTMGLWDSGPSIPTARESLFVAAVGERLFAIGGRSRVAGIVGVNEMLDCRPLFANVQNDVQASEADLPSTVLNGEDLSAFDIQGESNVWSVQDGMILGNNSGSKDGYLFSREEYRDFTMSVDFKVAGNTNSGVFFHSRLENGRIRGIQAEIQPPFEGKPGGTGCLYETGGRGWLINPDTLTQAQQTAFRTNDWNTLQIEVRNHRIQTKLNGIQIVDFVNHNPKWESGLIALQMMGNKDGSVWWRNMEVQSIP